MGGLGRPQDGRPRHHERPGADQLSSCRFPMQTARAKRPPPTPTPPLRPTGTIRGFARSAVVIRAGQTSVLPTPAAAFWPRRPIWSRFARSAREREERLRHDETASGKWGVGSGKRSVPATSHLPLAICHSHLAVVSAAIVAALLTAGCNDRVPRGSPSPHKIRVAVIGGMMETGFLAGLGGTVRKGRRRAATRSRSLPPDQKTSSPPPFAAARPT